MPKLKPHRGAKKRIKVTNKKGEKVGKLLKGSVRNSHLYRKETASSSYRKKRTDEVKAGYVKKVKKLIVK